MPLSLQNMKAFLCCVFAACLHLALAASPLEGYPAEPEVSEEDYDPESGLDAVRDDHRS